MPRIEIAERAGVGADGLPRPSEDHVVVTANTVVVLDGATAPHDQPHSGGWYARRLAERLEKDLTSAPTDDLGALLAGSIAAVAAEHRLPARRSPSSTVAMLRWCADSVEALVLADSPVVVFTASGPEVLADTRLSDLRRAGRLRTRADVDRLRNTRGGFWVAEADPTAAAHAVRRSWPRRDVEAVLVATDGVSIGVEQYHVMDWPWMLELVRARGAGAVLDEVRGAELGDPSALRWPRAKRHDDQALALIDFSGD